MGDSCISNLNKSLLGNIFLEHAANSPLTVREKILQAFPEIIIYVFHNILP